jgi:hypothetical protein
MCDRDDHDGVICVITMGGLRNYTNFRRSGDGPGRGLTLNLPSGECTCVAKTAFNLVAAVSDAEQEVANPKTSKANERTNITASERDGETSPAEGTVVRSFAPRGAT